VRLHDGRSRRGQGPSMLGADDLSTVLLVSGYRNNDLIDLGDPATRFMLDIGSGGSACVLRKNAGRNVVLASPSAETAPSPRCAWCPSSGPRPGPRNPRTPPILFQAARREGLQGQARRVTLRFLRASSASP